MKLSKILSMLSELSDSEIKKRIFILSRTHGRNPFGLKILRSELFRRKYIKVQPNETKRQ